MWILTLFNRQVSGSVLQQGFGLIVANVLCCLLDGFVELVHQLFVLFVDFVGDSEFILHSLKGILGHVAKGLNCRLSPLVQSSIGVSF